jgi:hypothetical protein
MKFAKISTFVTLICFPFLSLTAKKYTVDTNDEKIKCTLTTLSKQQMSNITGRWGPSFFDENHTFQSETAIQSKQVDPFGDAIQNLMAVEVTIKNNSSRTISLINGEYLDGITNMYVSPEELISTIYPRLNDNLWRNFIDGILVTTAGTAATSILALVARKIYLYECSCLHKRSLYKEAFPKKTTCPKFLSWLKNESQLKSLFNEEKNDLTPTIIATIGTCAVGILAALTCLAGYCTYKDKKKLDLSHAKEEDLRNSTFYERIKRDNERVVFASDETYLDIPPKSEFHSLFFIDLRKTKRKREIFNKLKPTLIYDN